MLRSREGGSPLDDLAPVVTAIQKSWQEVKDAKGQPVFTAAH